MSKTAPLPRQTRLLSSCAVAVIAALTVHMPVRAQALPALTPAEFQQGGFQGIGTPPSRTKFRLPSSITKAPTR
jgi:hypothetical protein